MKIVYKSKKRVSKKNLTDLFLSLEWESGNYPENLANAIRNSSHVITAWDIESSKNTLVGLINCLSDGYMAAYIHYLLVRPEYQKRGIGRTLLELMILQCSKVRQKVLISDDKQTGFYKKFGFDISSGFVSMYFNSY